MAVLNSLPQRAEAGECTGVPPFQGWTDENGFDYYDEPPYRPGVLRRTGRCLIDAVAYVITFLFGFVLGVTVL